VAVERAAGLIDRIARWLGDAARSAVEERELAAEA